MSDKIIHTNDTNFAADVLQAELPVLVDFWAPWCGPCKALTPVLDQAAEEFAGRLQIAKVNVDENQVTPTQYGVRGIPALMIFKGGELVASKVGLMNKAQLEAFINASI